MISVVIPYFSNKDGLAVLLVLLQQQTVLPAEIIVFDSSIDHSGKQLVERYSVTMPVTYRRHDGTIYDAWNDGGKHHAGDSVLFLNDDILIPTTCIEHFEYAARTFDAYSFVPEAPGVAHRDRVVTVSDFDWYQQSQIRARKTTWLKGFCFLLTQDAIDTVGLFDTSFKIWFGDTDYQERLLAVKKPRKKYTICTLDGLYVYHYGTTSYNLDERKTKLQTEKDEQLFDTKYLKKGYGQQVIERISVEQVT